jgi:hypothetical protein
VTKLYKANIHMAKELALMKEGQCLFEQKIQAIHGKEDNNYITILN